MELKEAVLNMLGYRGGFISGQEIADTLKVSRNAVWKAVKSLENEGYVFDSDKSRGYRLSDKNTRLCAAQIERFCGDTQIILLDSCVSTNTYAKALANEGAGENTLIIARSQTGGRGRLGRTFYSKEGGIYMSLILSPKIEPKECLQITVAAAAAMSQAISSVCGIETKIKWVNDLYKNSKKVCGILTESTLCAETAAVQHAVLGIGLNVAVPKGDFDKEIKKIATSLYKKSDVSSEIYSKIIGEFLFLFFEYYATIEDRKYLSVYRERSFLDGKKVTYEKNGAVFTGKVIGIDDNAGLIVEHGGKRTVLTSGEVTVKKWSM